MSHHLCIVISSELVFIDDELFVQKLEKPIK
jgi:hypothetical protein